MKPFLIFINAVSLCLVLATAASRADKHNVLLHEDFETLDLWQTVTSSDIEHETTYEIAEDDGDSVLKATSRSSASWLICLQEYDIAEHPILSWRWKVRNVYKKGDATRKDSDDVPLRLYVSIPYDPDKVGMVTRMKFSAVKSLYGRYPPLSSLCYIWANRPHDREMFPNAYNDRTRMIPLEQGSEKAGQWVEECVNVLEDYKKAFGKPPPAEARLGIMNDSDNTGEESVAYIDDIVIRAAH